MLGLENLSLRRKLFRLTSIVAILAIYPLAIITLLAQPVLGSAPTKTPDPKELDDFIEAQLRQKPFVGISVALGSATTKNGFSGPGVADLFGTLACDGKIFFANPRPHETSKRDTVSHHLDCGEDRGND